MLDLDAIESCAELTNEAAELAASSPQEMRKLLRRAAAVARPESGAPKLLMALAQLATAAWIEGELRVELSGDEDETKIELLCDYGLGIRERLLPMHSLYVPIDEFERAVLLAPKLIAPLHAQATSNGLVLTRSEVVDEAPPAYELEEQSLGDGERTTAPPPDELIELPDDTELDTAPPPATSAYESVIDELRAPLREKAPGDVHTRPTTRLAALTPDVIEALRRTKNA